MAYRSIVPAGDRLFFAAEDDAHGSELWTSDGTETGTVLVEDIFPGSASGVPGNGFRRAGPIAIGSLVFFAADDGVHGIELWRSDGTAAGTYLVRDVNASEFSASPSYLADAGGILVFSADDGQHGEEPWVSNGSSAGTQVLQDLLPGPASSRPRSFTRAAGRVYFAANDGESGIELWTVPLSAIQAATGRRLRFPQLLSFRP
jgi:ELWxxDGT repeat protein